MAANGASTAALNVGSPRVRAAMKVLGVHPRDVEPKDAASFTGGEGGLRYQMFEKKRTHLIGQVNNLASKGGEVSVQKSLQSSSGEDPNAAFLAEVERMEAENFARMAKMAKKEVQKIVIQELEAKLHQKNSEQKQEEGRQRLKELTIRRNDALRQQKKEGEKKQQRSLEVRQRADKQLLEKSETLANELAAASEKQGQKVAEIAESRVDGRIKKAEKMERIAERQAKKEKDFIKGREKMYDELCARYDDKIQRLEEILGQRQSKAEEITLKQQRSVEKVKTFQEEKQALAEKKYWEICERQDAAAKVREDNLAASTKEYKIKNARAKSSHEQRWDRIKKDIIEVQDSAMRTMLKSEDAGAARTLAARAASESKLLEVTEGRSVHADLVRQNRERNRRAHHYALEQRLSKLQSSRDRIKVMENAKKTADDRRMVVMRNCALEKHALEHQVDRIKDCKNPETMQGLLETLDPEPDAIARINELLGELGLSTMGTKEGEEEQGK